MFQINASKTYTETPEQSHFPAHTHGAYEVFCFLSGSASYSVEGNVYPLAPGDIIVLKNTETHHLILKKNTPYTRICIHFKPTAELSATFEKALMIPFSDRPIGLYNHYPARLFSQRGWLSYLHTICEAEDPVKQQVYFMVLLQELTDCFPMIKEMPTVYFTDNLSKITHYINSHLTDPLPLEDISSHFFISKSQLNRNFKKNLGTTVGDYILTKRLLMARGLIEQGQAPTAIFLQCGFHDYSVFFKAYKKKFGYAPGHTKEHFHTL